MNEPDWERKISALRRFDLDTLEGVGFDSGELRSWPIPHLTFVEIATLPKSGEEPGLPLKLQSLESSLKVLHEQHTTVGFLLLRKAFETSFYLGMSLPGQDTSDSTLSPEQQQLNALRAVLETDLSVSDEPVSVEALLRTINQTARHVGIITGMPPTLSSEQSGSRALSDLLKSMSGGDCGLLVLAAPIPRHDTTHEKQAADWQVKIAEQHSDPAKKKRIKYFLELEQAYLQHTSLGERVGFWQVCVYFFAADKEAFDHFRSSLTAAFGADGIARPTPLRTHEIPGLKEHLEQFGLIKSQLNPEEVFEKLLNFKFLTPLNSRQLASYLSVPAGR